MYVISQKKQLVYPFRILEVEKMMDKLEEGMNIGNTGACKAVKQTQNKYACFFGAGAKRKIYLDFYTLSML